MILKPNTQQIILLALLALVLLCAVLSLCSCSSLGELFKPMELVTPPQVVLEEKVATSQPSGATESRESKLTSIGSGYKGQTAEKFDSGGASASAKGGSNVNAGGGAARLAPGIVGMSSFGSLYVVGALVVVAGALVGYFISWKLGLLIAGAGIAGIAALKFIDQYPWVLLVGGVLAIGAVGYGVWRAYKERGKALTLQTIVGAIAGLPEDLSAKVKGAIAAYAGKNAETIKDVITEAKREENVQ